MSEKFEALKSQMKNQARKQIEAHLEKLVSQTKESVALTTKIANTTLVASFKKLGFVTHEQFEQLQNEVQELSERLDNLTSEVRASTAGREKKKTREQGSSTAQ